jgi:predicted HicB family RNase H-like nuclease
MPAGKTLMEVFAAMEREEGKRGRPPGRNYEKRLMVFLDEDRAAMLEERAKRMRVSKARIIRDLIDEASKRWRRESGAE